jgi:hypothetical protein
MEMVNGKAGLFKFLTKYFRKEIGPNYIDYLDQFSASKYFDANFPPVYLASGKVDPLNPATMAFIDSLEKYKRPHTDMIFGPERKDALHGFLNLYFLKSSQEALAGAIKFLNEN